MTAEMLTFPKKPQRSVKAACGAAMREARELAGLDLYEAAQRINLTLGTTVIGVGMLQGWEDGIHRAPAEALIAAVRLAGDDAVRIIASLL